MMKMILRQFSNVSVFCAFNNENIGGFPGSIREYPYVHFFTITLKFNCNQ